mmetsp:Transcript_1781/g.3596  ORF Transcript_1781/g.3596 Transcript_1781/m.3596 type:complete len:82 (+) Transcript_1781:517-762(+)
MKGKDLCHSSTAPVRISHYAVQYSGNDGVGTTISGVAHFTPHAESHAGFCHGMLNFRHFIFLAAISIHSNTIGPILDIILS